MPRAGSGPTVRLRLDGAFPKGPRDVSRPRFKAAITAAKDTWKALLARLDRGDPGFDQAVVEGARSGGDLESCLNVGRKLAEVADTLIVDGIGGSALGALAIESALRPKSRKLVVLDNVDPEAVHKKLAAIDPRRAAVAIVTKSGSTAETMANLLAIASHMEKAVGRSWLTRCVAITDPEKGDLRKLSQELGLKTLNVPPSVGGRFSVLTPVGLLPAAFLGVDASGLVHGALGMRRHCRESPLQGNLGVAGAVLLNEYARRGRRIHVTMPYADSLVHLSEWYRQLLGESVGKRFNRRGRRVDTGITPVVSLGATDQHSQVQLYVEGPQDKLITFLEVERFRNDVRLEKRWTTYSSLGYLGGTTLGTLLAAEKRGTEIALSAAGRPHATFVLPEITAKILGQLFYMFEFQVALLGELMNIDAFDQPGVEGGKVAAYALMRRPGYEREARALSARKSVGFELDSSR